MLIGLLLARELGNNVEIVTGIVESSP